MSPNETAERAAFETWATAERWIRGECEFCISRGYGANIGPYDEDDTEAAWQAWLARATAVPEGWKLVPIEPTMGMRSNTGLHHVAAHAVWTAMLAAAPHPEGAQ